MLSTVFKYCTDRFIKIKEGILMKFIENVKKFTFIMFVDYIICMILFLGCKTTDTFHVRARRHCFRDYILNIFITVHGFV